MDTKISDEFAVVHSITVKDTTTRLTLRTSTKLFIRHSSRLNISYITVNNKTKRNQI